MRVAIPIATERLRPDRGTAFRTSFRDHASPSSEKSGGRFRATTYDPCLSSSSSTISMSSTFSVRLKIVAAMSLKGVWRASKLEGTIEQRSSAQLRCVSSGTDESFTATLYPA